MNRNPLSWWEGYMHRINHIENQIRGKNFFRGENFFRELNNFPSVIPSPLQIKRMRAQNLAVKESYFITFQVVSISIVLKSIKKNKPTHEDSTFIFLPSHSSGNKSCNLEEDLHRICQI